jgi:hypothetical protein
MSDIEMYQRQGCEAVKKFYLQMKQYVDNMVAMLEVDEPFQEPFKRELLRSTQSTLEKWRSDFQEVMRFEQNLDDKISKLNK